MLSNLVCTATAAAACAGVVNDGTEATCTSAGDCTYTPHTCEWCESDYVSELSLEDIPEACGDIPEACGDIPEVCVATAATACDAVVNDGTEATCTDAGACTYVRVVQVSAGYKTTLLLDADGRVRASFNVSSMM